jgi:surface polysaccharide O-acyltransferase-like enzyme
VDLVRVVALLGVAGIHAAAWMVPAGASPTGGPVAAFATVARFSVPSFVFLSGLVLYRSSCRPADRGRFLRRRWSRVLLPWLLWIPVFLAVDVWQGQVSTQAEQVGDWLASGPGLLYFLFAIAQLYLLLLILPRSRKWLLAFALAALALQLGLGLLHTYRPPEDGPLAWPLTWMAQDEAPFWAGYFCLGCLAGAEFERLRLLRKYWPAAVAATAGSGALLFWQASTVPAGTWTQGLYVFFWPALLPFTLSLTTALIWAGHWAYGLLRPVWSAIQSVSQHSLGIYLLQSLVLGFLGPITSGLGWPARLPVLTLVSVGLAWGIVVLMTRTWWGSIWVGERKVPDARARCQG